METEKRPPLSLDQAFRMFFLAYALVASGLALAMHLKQDLWACASCSFVDSQPFGAGLAWIGPPLLAALLVTTRKGWKFAALSLSGAAVVSLGLIAVMLRSGNLCPVCLAVHIGVLAAALSLLPRGVWWSSTFFGAALLFASTGGWDKLSDPVGVGVFRPRHWETVPAGDVVVLFSDPECERCRLAETRLAEDGQITVLHRWTLLPHGLYRTMRAAVAIEAASAEFGQSKGQAFREALFAKPPPYTDEVILDAARGVGMERQCRQWLTTPPAAALQALDDDQTTSDELGVRNLPAVAQLDPPDASGSRRLHLLPLPQ
ncbi:MAG: hypothetical protein KF857_07145 [Fimbriimonadaceae bacterium]|nr:hypothetical protein [Fimbriimonadaceae bacterium]